MSNFLQFEEDLKNKIETFIGKDLPKTIPIWMVQLGIRPESKISNVRRVGQSGSKTDVLVAFDNGRKLKISVKMSNADYFGNWYSFTRLNKDFGAQVFNPLSKACTAWANKWMNDPNASLFVGVSVSFGTRSGSTGENFSHIFKSNPSEILKVVAGCGSDDHSANCLYAPKIKNSSIDSIDDLFQALKPLNSTTIFDLFTQNSFKVIYRPINPMTEYSNRGKCIYTKFVPYAKLPEMTTVSTLSELRKLGEFKVVSMADVSEGKKSFNHNDLLNNLRNNYNIDIVRKSKNA